MKATELIERLQVRVAEYGDREVILPVRMLPVDDVVPTLAVLHFHTAPEPVLMLSD